jgi:hypothetical protein
MRCAAIRDQTNSHKEFCILLPTPVCKRNLMQMTHIRTCHVYKGFIGKCAGCGKKITTNRIINAVIRSANQSLKMM